MLSNQERYLFSRRGGVPSPRGPRRRPRPDLDEPSGGARPRAPLVRRLVPAVRVALREFRLALDDGGERYRAR